MTEVPLTRTETPDAPENVQHSYILGVRRTAHGKHEVGVKIDDSDNVVSVATIGTAAQAQLLMNAIDERVRKTAAERFKPIQQATILQGVLTARRIGDELPQLVPTATTVKVGNIIHVVRHEDVVAVMQLLSNRYDELGIPPAGPKPAAPAIEVANA